MTVALPKESPIRFRLVERMLAGGSWHVGIRRIGSSAFEGPLHDHDGFHEIMLCLAGGCESYVRDRWLDLRPGEMAFIAETDLHKVRGRHCRWVNVAFSFDWLTRGEEALAGGGRIESLSRRAAVPSCRLGSDELAVVACRLSSIGPDAQGDASDTHFRLLLLELLGRFVSEAGANRRRRVRPGWLADLLDRFAELPPADQSRARLVELSGRCEEHLCRVFRKSLGLTPTEYLNALRLDRAADLLRITDRSVTDIALDCGYEGLSYFYRRFARRFGCPPREYRRRHCQAL
jgi:AraC family cel operon transcriptional repressor